MKRVIIFALPLLLASCGSPSQYQSECAGRSDKFSEVFTCTKTKLYSDPRATSLNPNVSHTADNQEIIAYGEELNSQVRQGLITDAQAKQLFARKISTIQERREPAPLPLKDGRY